MSRLGNKTVQMPAVEHVGCVGDAVDFFYVEKHRKNRDFYINLQNMQVEMTKDDVQTIKAVLLYIIKNSRDDRRDVYSIVKTAYYAQQLHFVHWALPIFNDRIAALPFGPVPSNLYNILRLSRGEENERRFLQQEGLDAISDAIGFDSESFYVKEEPDLNYLSESNIECLNEAIQKVAFMNFDNIVKDTHGIEWRRAYCESPNKIMDNLNIAREGGAAEDVVEYLQDALEWKRSLS